VQVSVTISGVSRLFGADLAGVVEAARVADAAGVHQIVLPDHLAIGTRTDRYPFAPTFPYPPEEPWLEPVATLAAIAAVTETVRLGTGVLVAPLRSALLLAKQVATLDVLSHGRVDLGIGTGWQREEFTEAGAPFVGRTARMDDQVLACRALWEREPPVSFTSETVSFTDLWCEPRPVQARLPIWFGGDASLRTARRIAAAGDGWLPVGVTPDEVLIEGIANLRTACEEVGRDPAELGVRAGVPVALDASGRVDLAATRSRAEELGAFGVTTVSVALGRFLAGPADVAPFLADLGAAFAED
jgi:probable F420-dependent oxidoreductase